MSYTTDFTFTFPDASLDLGFNFDYTPMGIHEHTPMDQGDNTIQWSDGPMDGGMMDGSSAFNLSYNPSYDTNLSFHLDLDQSTWVPTSYEQLPSQASTSQDSQDLRLLEMFGSSTPPLSSGSSSNSGSPSWPWDLSPSTSAPSHLEHHTLDANFTVCTPAPATHDHQDLLSFLNNLQAPAPLPAPRPKHTRNSARRQLRAATPRVACPNFHLCGKTFCRKDVLNRHLKKTCGVQCESCTGRIPVGVTCAHHQGAGRPVMPERMVGGWARAAAPY